MDIFYKTKYLSPLGEIVLIADKNSLVGLYFENRKTYFKKENIILKENNNLSIFLDVKKWLDDYFNRKNPDVSKLSLNFVGATDFQKEVWKILLPVPYGKTMTYKDIKNELIKKLSLKSMSNQAVANAISKNPILIIIPCHRIIASDGSLKGYVAGLDIKEKLLQIEGYKSSSSINESHPASCISSR